METNVTAKGGDGTSYDRGFLYQNKNGVTGTSHCALKKQLEHQQAPKAVVLGDEKKVKGLVPRAPRGASPARTGVRHYWAEALNEERVEVGLTGSLAGGPANLTDVWSDGGARRLVRSARGVVGSVSGKRILAGKGGSASGVGSSSVSISS